MFSSDELASAIDTFTQTNLNMPRTAAQDPTFISYLSQSAGGLESQGKLLPRCTVIEQVGAQTLLAIVNLDPANIISCNILDVSATVQLSTNQAEIGENEGGQDYYMVPYMS